MAHRADLLASGITTSSDRERAGLARPRKTQGSTPCGGARTNASPANLSVRGALREVTTLRRTCYNPACTIPCQQPTMTFHDKNPYGRSVVPCILAWFIIYEHCFGARRCLPACTAPGLGPTTLPHVILARDLSSCHAPRLLCLLNALLLSWSVPRRFGSIQRILGAWCACSFHYRAPLCTPLRQTCGGITCGGMRSLTTHSPLRRWSRHRIGE